MQYRRLDENGDMLPATALYPPLKDAEAVGAAIRSRLLSFSGEWWEDEDDGIPVEMLFGHISDDDRIVADALIRERIAETEGVSDVLELIISDDAPNRTRTIRITVETVYGQNVTVEV